MCLHDESLLEGTEKESASSIIVQTHPFTPSPYKGPAQAEDDRPQQSATAHDFTSGLTVHCHSGCLTFIAGKFQSLLSNDGVFREERVCSCPLRSVRDGESCSAAAHCDDHCCCAPRARSQVGGTPRTHGGVVVQGRQHIIMFSCVCRSSENCLGTFHEGVNEDFGVSD